MNEEVPWYELVTPLTSGAEGVATSLAKCLIAAWWWNIKVRGEGDCSSAPSVLNIGQFITDEEAAGGVGEPHWFVACSRALQRVGEAARGRKWEWPRREALEIKASQLALFLQNSNAFPKTLLIYILRLLISYVPLMMGIQVEYKRSVDGELDCNSGQCEP